VEPFRFGRVDRPLPRRFAALALAAVALTVPLIPAIGIAAGSSHYWQTALVIWAICAIPALVLAAVVAARPRVPRVLAGVTLLEAMIVGATYLVFAIAGDRPQRTSGHARQPASSRAHPEAATIRDGQAVAS
jgi:hypothetical protein